MKYIYPIKIVKEKNVYKANFLDFAISFEGDNFESVITMAKWLLWRRIEELKQEEIPMASDPFFESKILEDNACISLVELDIDEYRRKYDSKAVKKTLTIPNWLNEKAEAANLNFSHVLQEALKAKLNLK